MLRLLVCVAGALMDFSSLTFEVVLGTFVGNWSSSKVCQIMLGGLLITLNMANLTTGAMLSEKGVYKHFALASIRQYKPLHVTYSVFVGRYRLRKYI
jgi:hypothetical protein